MLALILGMLICIGLAVTVLGLVAVPARREGRVLLASEGEEVVSAIKARQQSSRERFGRSGKHAAAGRGTSDSSVDSSPGTSDPTGLRTEPTSAQATGASAGQGAADDVVLDDAAVDGIAGKAPVTDPGSTDTDADASRTRPVSTDTDADTSRTRPVSTDADPGKPTA